MSMKHIEDDLLVKHLLGTTTEAEEQQVAEWTAASTENRKQLDDFRHIWEQSKTLRPQASISEDAAWERFVKRTEATLETPGTGRSIDLTRIWLRAAAAIIILCGAGWLFYSANRGPELLTATSGDGVLTDTLPDGSVIVLNKNSSLSYPSKFDGDNRPVTLTGEAFFSITPNKSKPFVIAAGGSTVTVVGTTFNVKTNDGQTEVVVETGIVQVSHNDKSVRLTPHQKTIVGSERNAPEALASTDDLYSYYRTGEIVCNATPLSRLAPALSDAYGVHITISNQIIADMQLTATFRNESLGNILKVVRESLNITVEQKGNSITLR